MREASSEKKEGVITLRMEGKLGPGSGKKILAALPACFYAVDLHGGYAHLYHHQTGEAKIAEAVAVVLEHGRF